MWKLHAKLLTETTITESKDTKKVTKVTELKVGQLVFVKDHYKGTFNPTYIFNHRVAGIRNDSTVLLTTPHGKGKRCNIHYIKLVTAQEASASAFHQFQDSI